MLDTNLSFGGAFYMTRITFEQKLDTIFRVEKGDEGITSIAKSLNFTNTELIHFWIGKYHLHGPESLKKSYTRYSVEDKLYILNYMNENRLSDIETAVHFNLPTPGTIRKWRISLQNVSVDTLVLKEKGHKKLLYGYCFNRIIDLYNDFNADKNRLIVLGLLLVKFTKRKVSCVFITNLTLHFMHQIIFNHNTYFLF